MRILAPLTGAILCVGILSTSSAGYADTLNGTNQSAINLFIEGNQVQSDVPPKLIDGRTLVPIRIIADSFQSKVDWDSKVRTVSIQGDSTQISMQIGSNKAQVNGKEIVMDVPPTIEGGRALVPLRFIGESLGTTVGWEQDTQSVLINKVCTAQIGNVTLDKDIFKLNGDLLVPLKDAAGATNVAFPDPKADQKMVVEGKSVDLEKDGKQQWKLRKIGDVLYIPLSIVQKEFPVPQSKPTDPSPSSSQGDPNSSQGNQNSSTSSTTQLLAIQNNSDKVILKTSALVNPSVFKLDNPDRIVVDMPGTDISDAMRASNGFQNNMGIVSMAGQTPNSIIKQIRYSLYLDDPKTVRVVFELNQKASYTMNTTSDGLEFSFQVVPPKQGYTVVIDAGHGGKDTGAIGITGNYEKDLTINVANLVTADLQKDQRFHVVETRTGDTYPTLQDRVQIAENADADLFLSIHANSFDPSATGTETYYYTPQSQQLATIMHKHLLAATGFADRGVKQSGFYVIKNTTMPSNLVELGFLTNANDDKQMLTPEFQNRVAQSLADAIIEYYNSNH